MWVGMRRSQGQQVLQFAPAATAGGVGTAASAAAAAAEEIATVRVGAEAGAEARAEAEEGVGAAAGAITVATADAGAEEPVGSAGGTQSCSAQHVCPQSQFGGELQSPHIVLPFAFSTAQLAPNENPGHLSY